MTTCELILALSLLDKTGPSRIAHFVKLYNYDHKRIEKSLGLNFKGREKELKNASLEARRIIDLNSRKGIKCICLLDKEFPKNLCEASDPVVFLYYKGDISLLKKKGITIIGTREPHNEFIKSGKVAAEYFAKKNYVIVSGLAIGCDSIAHNAALKFSGKTIATLPSSIDNIMPKCNAEMANSIAKNGGLLISEYSVDSHFNKFNYAQRDRIQSLLTNVTLVIETTEAGGSMIAARKSIKDDKKVFALKGNNIRCIKEYVDAYNIKDLEKVESNI